MLSDSVSALCSSIAKALDEAEEGREAAIIPKCLYLTWPSPYIEGVSTRFEMNADTLEIAALYFKRRALQARIDGVVPESTEVEALYHQGTAWGVRAFARTADGTRVQTLYTYASQRGRGHMSRYLSETRVPVVTTPDCNIEAYLARKNAPHLVVSRITDTSEYKAIEAFYGDRAAKRSGVLLMNHIDEGLVILAERKAPESAQRAFCIHPILQADEDLARAYRRLPQVSESPHVLALAMEYRNIANSTLSHRHIEALEQIALSPLPEVNAMLVADKIQNFKDFILFHQATHTRAKELTCYFVRWLTRLGITKDEFAKWFAALQLFDAKLDFHVGWSCRFPGTATPR
jgi:hypothetical protein